MTDILPYAAKLLGPLSVQIELSFQNTRVTFPLIVLSVVSDSAVCCDRTEVFTRMTVQLDVYTRDKHETMLLSKSADELMTAGGFTRTAAQTFTEAGLERRMLQYSCKIDYTHNTIIT